MRRMVEEGENDALTDTKKSWILFPCHSSMTVDRLGTIYSKAKRQRIALEMRISLVLFFDIPPGGCVVVLVTNRERERVYVRLVFILE